MKKAELVSIVCSLLPAGATWPTERGGPRVEGGKTVLMLVTARELDPHLAVKLIDLVCHHYTGDFWARDVFRRHVIMDACHRGVDPLVLRRLIKWARKSFRVVIPMSREDVNGLNAVELAIAGGHGQLASCLLEQHGASSHVDRVQRGLTGI